MAHDTVGWMCRMCPFKAEGMEYFIVRTICPPSVSRPNIEKSAFRSLLACETGKDMASQSLVGEALIYSITFSESQEVTLSVVSLVGFTYSASWLRRFISSYSHGEKILLSKLA